MPAVIISQNEDGSATVAPIDATPEMLQDGEQFASMDEATKAVSQVFSAGDDAGKESDIPMDGGTGDGGMQDAGADDGGEAPPGTEEPLSPEEEAAQMGQGYNAARRGR